MKKLHSLALCALVTPVITFGAGSVLAQQSTERDTDRKGSSMQHDQNMQHDQRMQRDKDARKSGAVSTQDAQGKQSSERSDSKTLADRQNNRHKSGKQNKGFMDSAPAKGLHASNLMDATVKTTDGEDVGSINDLIIDEDGQIVAVVVGVGGILGMGEKDVAIGWDDVKRSGESKRTAAGSRASTAGDSDDLELTLDKSRDELRSAPEFKNRD